MTDDLNSEAPPVLEPLRTRAMRVIATAEAHGILTPVNAFEHRAFAEEARTAAALERLVAGIKLPPEVELLPTPVALAPVTPPALTPVTTETERSAAAYGAPTVMRVSTTLGSEERRGEWAVPDAMELECFMGSIELDLRGAYVTGDVLDIDYSLVLGAIKIIVPPGVEVQANNETRLGSFEHRIKRNADPVGQGFLLRIVGSNWLGSVEVIEKPMPTGEGALDRVGRWLRLN